MTILDRARDAGRIRIDTARFADELARRLSDAEQFDITRARESAGVAVHDAADRARDSFDHAAELIRVLRGDIANAGDKGESDGPLDEVGQRLRALASTTAIRSLIARLERELPDTDRDRYAIAFARGRAQGRSKYLVLGIAAGVTAGIAAAALFEPAHGKERREQIGRKAGSLRAVVSSRAASTAKVVGGRARGIAVERGLVKPDAGDSVAIEAGLPAPDVINPDDLAPAVVAEAPAAPDVAGASAADVPSPTA